MKMLLGVAALAVSLGALPVAGQTYNVVSDFGSPVFSYGFGTGPTAFQAAQFNQGCLGDSSLSCYAPSANSVPTVVKNTSMVDQTPGTFTVPTDTLMLHPGVDPTIDALLAFTSTSGGLYSLSSAFSRLDNTDGGNGVIVSIFSVNNGVALQLFSSSIANTNPSAPTFNSNVILGSGGQIVFAVNNAGDVSYDSTGLRASISAVPEPATWAMMMLGFTMIGFGIRSRRKPAVRITYA